MPITRPWASTSAPPLLPGLTAASVWIALVTTCSPALCPPPNGFSPLDSACVVTGRSRR